MTPGTEGPSPSKYTREEEEKKNHIRRSVALPLDHKSNTEQRWSTSPRPLTLCSRLPVVSDRLPWKLTHGKNPDQSQGIPRGFHSGVHTGYTSWYISFILHVCMWNAFQMSSYGAAPHLLFCFCYSKISLTWGVAVLIHKWGKLIIKNNFNKLLGVVVCLQCEVTLFGEWRNLHQ